MIEGKFLDKQDTYSFLLSAIYASKADDRYALLSDLIYILDEQNFKNFLTLYEGQTIKIPSMQVISEILRAISIYAYHDIDGMSIYEACKKVGMKDIPKQGFKGPAEYLRLRQCIRDHNVEIGGILDGFPSNKALVTE